MHPATHFQHHPPQVEVRNVRQRSGFEVDIFAASPNATVEYLDCVYYCFSCLPPPILVNLMYQLPKPPDEPDVRVGYCRACMLRVWYCSNCTAGFLVGHRTMCLLRQRQ